MEQIIRGTPEAAMILHLGDLSRDAVLLSALFPTLPFKNVNGNNDFRPDLPDEMLLDIAGKRVFLCHGHRHRVKYGLDMLLKAATEKGADLALFGHTHLPYCDVKNGIYLLNPGSIHGIRGSYGVAEINQNDIKIQTIPFERNSYV
jgi:putative phosphoesterase